MAAWLRPQANEPRTSLQLVTIYTRTRVRLLEAVNTRPGASMTDVARTMGVHVSTVQSNTHLLKQGGLIRTERDGRKVRLYAVGTLSERELFMARLGVSATVYEAIMSGVPGRVVPLSHACGISRNAARHQLSRLVKLGAIRATETRVLVTQTTYRVIDDAEDA